MEKLSVLYFNDLVPYSDKQYDSINEFKSYITSLFYSFVILFDGLNITSKPSTESNTYEWKLTINENVELCATMTTTAQTSNNIWIKLVWEVLCKNGMSEQYINMAEYLCVIIIRECKNLHSFFEFRTIFSEH
jgi:hypothetical protein